MSASTTQPIAVVRRLPWQAVTIGLAVAAASWMPSAAAEPVSRLEGLKSAYDCLVSSALAISAGPNPKLDESVTFWGDVIARYPADDAERASARAQAESTFAGLQPKLKPIAAAAFASACGDSVLRSRYTDFLARTAAPAEPEVAQ